MIEHNKDFKSLSDKLMEQQCLESPSEFFTNNVISQLELNTEKPSIHYKPLISSKIIYLMVGFVSIIITIIFYTGIIDLSSFMSFSSKEFFNNMSLNSILPSVNISSIIIYTTMLFASLFIVQVTAIKRMHSQSLNF